MTCDQYVMLKFLWPKMKYDFSAFNYLNYGSNKNNYI